MRGTWSVRVYPVYMCGVRVVCVWWVVYVMCVCMSMCGVYKIVVCVMCIHGCMHVSHVWNACGVYICYYLWCVKDCGVCVMCVLTVLCCAWINVVCVLRVPVVYVCMHLYMHFCGTGIFMCVWYVCQCIQCVYTHVCVYVGCVYNTFICVLCMCALFVVSLCVFVCVYMCRCVWRHVHVKVLKLRESLELHLVQFSSVVQSAEAWVRYEQCWAVRPLEHHPEHGQLTGALKMLDLDPLDSPCL